MIDRIAFIYLFSLTVVSLWFLYSTRWSYIAVSWQVGCTDATVAQRLNELVHEGTNHSKGGLWHCIPNTELNTLQCAPVQNSLQHTVPLHNRFQQLQVQPSMCRVTPEQRQLHLQCCYNQKAWTKEISCSVKSLGLHTLLCQSQIVDGRGPILPVLWRYIPPSIFMKSHVG